VFVRYVSDNLHSMVINSDNDNSGLHDTVEMKCSKNMIVHIPFYWPSETYQDQIHQLCSEKKRMHSVYLKCVN
jgi:hypothetical protein